jgi:tetratricopeptide (TPR) repeat protein
MKTTELETNYQSMFIEYVISGVQEALERVRTAEPLPNEHDRQLAWHILSYAFNFDEVWPFTRELLLTLAPKMEQAGFREDWMLYLEQGVCQSQALNDESITAECQLQIGMLYRLQSKFDLARQQLTASVAGFAALQAAHDQARALNELAWLAHLQHHYTEATQHVETALALLNDEDPERAMCYRVLGIIAFEQRQWQKAEEFHRKALILFEKQRDRRRVAWGAQNLANALRLQERFKESIDYYQQSIVILDELNDINNQAIVQLNLGVAYLYSGNPTKAEECHIQAEIVFQKLNDRLNLARINTNLGLDYLALQEYTKAEQCFLISSELHQEVGNKHLYLNALDGLAITYLAYKEYDKALKILQQALEELPQIEGMTNYNYLLRKMNEHLDEARRGHELSEISS